MKKRYFWIIAAVIAAVIAAAAAGASVFFEWQQQRQKEATAQRYEQIRREQTDFLGDIIEMAEDAGKKEPLVIPVDFEGLWEINPDIYAWITIPGTVIDYPIVQHPTDNTFYLDKTVEKTPSVSGSIYTELYNKKDFSDPHTVIYGHNMRDGSMFAGLHQYENEEFWEDHREIRIYTPDSILHYQVFAAYPYDNRHLLESADCTNEEIYQIYLNEIFGQRSLNAILDYDVDVTTEDRILTLSTCSNTGNAYRYLVQAVLVQEEK